MRLHDTTRQLTLDMKNQIEEAAKFQRETLQIEQEILIGWPFILTYEYVVLLM